MALAVKREERYTAERYDRGKKFEFYRTLSTVQERLYVEHYHKLAIGRWEYRIVLDFGETVKLQSIQLEIPIRLIYEQLDWLDRN